MTAHPSIAKEFTKGDKVEVDHLWPQLEVELNASGPQIKDGPFGKRKNKARKIELELKTLQLERKKF
ncbi:hypothetical protein FF38_03423 [Lucilia cuprina]|uniref:Uncharacterized protein n=1 Tax=Lucilia cuprina TaxID=7375 RepID=A0A0L0BRI9_LUCCU|nr:hypothetical protein FF38_03423 [Lucilia cuprina]